MTWKDKIDKAHKGQSGFFKEIENEKQRDMKDLNYIKTSSGYYRVSVWLDYQKVNEFDTHDTQLIDDIENHNYGEELELFDSYEEMYNHCFKQLPIKF